MKKQIQITIAIAVGMLSALPIGSASATPVPSNLVTKSQYFNGVPGSSIRAILPCPSGYRLVGSGGGYGIILGETPVNNFTAVQLSAFILYDVPNNSAYAEIKCAPANQFADVITISSTEHSLKPNQINRGIVTCPSGMYAFGGGGYFSSSGSDIQGSAYNASNSPSADGRSWTYSGVGPENMNSNSTLVTLTQCAPKVGRDVLIQSGTPLQSITSFASVYADCPAGYTALSGGFYASNPNGTEVLGYSPIWSVPASRQQPSASSWFAGGYAPANTKLVSLAQCIR